MKAKKKLSKKEKQELAELEQSYRLKGGVSAELFYGEEMNAIVDANCFFYEKEPDGSVGFLSMFLPDETQAELTAALFTEDTEKKRMLFNKLVSAACAECERIGVKEIRLVTDPKNGFWEGLQKMPFAVSEYMLAVETEMLAKKAEERVRTRKEAHAAKERGTADEYAESKKKTKTGRQTKAEVKGNLSEAREFAGYEEDGEWEYILWENEDALCSCRILRFGAGEEAYLYGLLTGEEVRRRGIATEFLAELAKELAADGCRILKLQVYSENHPAMALYRGLGFIVDEQRDYYTVQTEGN